MIDFEKLREEVSKKLDWLFKHADRFAWLDFGDRGNPCYSPYVFASEEEEEREALTMAAVRLEMAKNSREHLRFAKKVNSEIGGCFISYDWLLKSVTRILSGFISWEKIQNAEKD